MDNRKVREAPAKYGAGTFLAITMMVCAAFMLLTRFFSLEIDGVLLSVDDGAIGIFSKAMLIIGGLIILIKRRKGNYFAVGIYALTLGTSRLIRSFPNLAAESDIRFYSAIVIIALSANLAITGYNHLTVRMKNPINMRYTTLVTLAIYCTVLLYLVYIGADPKIVFNYLPDVMWYIPVYVALLVVLFSREIVDNSPLGRIRSFSAETADKFGLGDDLSVSAEDVEKIKAGIKGPEGWKVKEIGGSAVSEETVTFCSRRGDRDVVLERCEGDGGLNITVIDDREDSFINGCRLKVSSYNEFHGILELVDDTGVCAVLHVRGLQRWTSRIARYTRIT